MIHEPRIFLSYASEDHEIAKKFYEALQEQHIAVFFDKKNLGGGEKWDKVLQDNIRESWLFVPFDLQEHTHPRKKGTFGQSGHKQVI